MGEQDSFGISM